MHKPRLNANLANETIFFDFNDLHGSNKPKNSDLELKVNNDKLIYKFNECSPLDKCTASFSDFRKKLNTSSLDNTQKSLDHTSGYGDDSFTSTSFPEAHLSQDLGFKEFGKHLQIFDEDKVFDNNSKANDEKFLTQAQQSQNINSNDECNKCDNRSEKQIISPIDKINKSNENLSNETNIKDENIKQITINTFYATKKSDDRLLDYENRLKQFNWGEETSGLLLKKKETFCIKETFEYLRKKLASRGKLLKEKGSIGKPEEIISLPNDTNIDLNFLKTKPRHLSKPNSDVLDLKAPKSQNFIDLENDQKCLKKIEPTKHNIYPGRFSFCTDTDNAVELKSPMMEQKNNQTQTLIVNKPPLLDNPPIVDSYHKSPMKSPDECPRDIDFDLELQIAVTEQCKTFEKPNCKNDEQSDESVLILDPLPADATHEELPLSKECCEITLKIEGKFYDALQNFVAQKVPSFSIPYRNRSGNFDDLER